MMWSVPHLAVSANAAGEPWQTFPKTPSLPTSTHSAYAPVNGIRMYYAIFGTGDAVRLLHRGLANSNYWVEVIPGLVRNHFQVIVADSRGHGRSTRSTEPLSYELMASDTLALLDYLKLKRVNVVGWSDGGIIGLVLAMQHPERPRRVFAYGANSDPSGVLTEADANPIFTTYADRTRSEYEQLSSSLKEYPDFLKDIQAIWAQQPNYSVAQLQKNRRADRDYGWCA